MTIYHAKSISDIRGEVERAQDELKRRADDLLGPHHKPIYWYRGCARESYRLLPSLFRFAEGPAVEMQLFDYFSAFKRGTVEGNLLREWQILFKMQHHRTPTRCLDWTEDLDVAFYFAFFDESCSNPSVFVLEPTLLNRKTALRKGPAPFPIERSEFEYPHHYDPVPRHDLPIAVIPDRADPRIELQKGRFTIHGKERTAIEELCPEVCVKVVLDVALDTSGRTALRQRMVKKEPVDIFPDDEGMAATLCDRYALKFSAEGHIKGLLERLWEHDLNELEQRDTAPETWMRGISGCKVGDRYIEPAERGNLRNWLENTHERLAIVTGEAAGGKTNYILNEARGARGSPASHRALIFSLGTFAPRERSLLRGIADFLEGIPTGVLQSIDVRALEEMIRDGQIWLVLDGLDELTRTQGKEVLDSLKDELRTLVSSRAPRIIIGCRKHILQGLKLGDVIDIEGVREIVPKLDAVKIENQLRAVTKQTPEVVLRELSRIIAERPLFDDLVRRIIADKPTDLKNIEQVGKNTGKGAFWPIWIRIAMDDAKFNPPRSFENFCGELAQVAVKMLTDRKDWLDDNELSGSKELVSTVSKQRCPLFVREGNKKWRFSHQAIREFTLAQSLRDGFANIHADSAMKTTGAFDYESAETYFYLRDLPGWRMDTVIKEVDHLDFVEVCRKDREKWNNFLRNYFEAVGMLGASEAAFPMASLQALKVIGAPPESKISFRTKYNAARCLARLHPSGPRDYCTFVTRDRWQSDARVERLVYGFAVRGFQRSEPRPGSDPPEAFMKDFRELPVEQSALANRIVGTLVQIVTELSRPAELHPHALFLQINASHALIRWMPNAGVFPLPNRNAPQVMNVNNLLSQADLEFPVLANLLLALKVHGHLNKRADPLFKVEGTPERLKVQQDEVVKAAFGRDSNWLEYHTQSA